MKDTRLFDKLKDMYFLFMAFVKNPVSISLIIFIALEWTTYYVFHTKLNVDKEIVVGSMSVLCIVSGYFITHYLELDRKSKEKRFDQHYELLKALRVFLCETDLEEADRKALAEKFQHEYYGSALFISQKAFKKLKITADSYNEFQNTKGKLAADIQKAQLNFQNAQSNFINSLRTEFFHDRNLDFSAYDFQWKLKK